MTTTSDNFNQNLQNWLKWDKTDAEKIKKLPPEQLKQMFQDNKRISFGTAGLRAKMAPGPKCMNDLTVIQTTQGLIQYAEKIFSPATLTDQGIVVSYDARHNSKDWAAMISNICRYKQIMCYTFNTITPTPFVPFAVRNLKACLGIMITASHNPKSDNGYKVYWQDGAHIVPPHDKNVAKMIGNHLRPWNDKYCYDKNFHFDDDHDMVEDVYEWIWKQYFKQLSKLRTLHSTINFKLKIVYTPVHGVGLEACQYAIKNVFGFKNFHAVPCQSQPDPEFSTVSKCPNPEEGYKVLKYAFEYADEIGADLVLASDPDADRLAVAQRCLANKEEDWRIFSGNECGAILGYWALQRWKEKNPDPNTKPSNCYMLSSTYSSMILKTMAKMENFNFEDTLAGFKFIGNRTAELVKNNKQVLFAFEEAIGYMFSDTLAFDKDGVSAAGVFAELVAYLDSKNMKLEDYLDVIYQKYGYHLGKTNYFICDEENNNGNNNFDQKIEVMFENIRSFYEKNSKLGDFEISAVRDLKRGYDSREEGNVCKIERQNSHLVTFYFENGATIWVGWKSKLFFFL